MVRGCEWGCPVDGAGSPTVGTGIGSFISEAVGTVMKMIGQQGKLNPLGKSL